jgi:outer membrane biosynthesis protein TonB
LTLTQNRQLQTGLAGSLVVHAVLLVLFVLGFSFNWGKWEPHLRPLAKPVEPEVVLLFPSQVVPPPPAPPPKPVNQPKQFIRTSQNEAAPKAAAKSAFESDRNTVAASQKAASPDATLAMPTMDGVKVTMNELANRNFRDGEQASDSPPKALPVPQMLPPQPVVSEPPPPLVAKAEPKPETLTKLIEDMDRETVRLEVNRLPIEIRKPGDFAPDSPPAPAPATKKPPPFKDPLEPRKKVGTDGFSPFTRTSAIKGTITNRGANAVDAERTAQGAYASAINSAVEKKWHSYRRIAGDAVSFGSLEVEFYVNRSGDIEDLRITSAPGTADTRMADFTLRAIQDADIPPIPEDVLPLLDDQRMPVRYDVIIR